MEQNHSASTIGGLTNETNGVGVRLGMRFGGMIWCGLVNGARFPIFPHVWLAKIKVSSLNVVTSLS